MKRHRRTPQWGSLVPGLVVVCVLAGCPEDRTVVTSCTGNSDCPTGLCYQSDCLDPDGDLDADGLTNVEEVGFGTDPMNPDTDGDGAGDQEEVGNDSDGDMIDDALESSVDGAEDDCKADQFDATNDVPDPEPGCPLYEPPACVLDTDGDGLCDDVDPDDDNDGSPDELDCRPTNPTISPLVVDTVCDGVDSDCSAGGGAAPVGAVFVAPAPTGAPGNAGTAEFPVATIAEAVPLAAGGPILLQEGTYAAVSLTDADVDIHGGFVGCDFEPGEDTVSVIDGAGGTAVLLDGTSGALERVDVTTTISGGEVIVMQVTGSSAVNLRDVSVIASTTGAAQVTGIAVDTQGGLIVEGGAIDIRGPATVFGVRQLTGWSQLYGVDLRFTDTAATTGLAILDGSFTLANSTIEDTMTTPTTDKSVYGVRSVGNALMTLVGNRFVSTASPVSSGQHIGFDLIAETGTATVINNVFEFVSTNVAAAMRLRVAEGLMYRLGGNLTTAIPGGEVELLATTPPTVGWVGEWVGRHPIGALNYAPDSWMLEATRGKNQTGVCAWDADGPIVGSPCHEGGVDASLAGGWNLDVDAVGQARPVGAWDRGPRERREVCTTVDDCQAFGCTLASVCGADGVCVWDTQGGNYDGDAECDNVDDDPDQDGVAGAADSCPLGAVGWTSDGNNDADGDGCLADTPEEHDRDGDGTPDWEEACGFGTWDGSAILVDFGEPPGDGTPTSPFNTLTAAVDAATAAGGGDIWLSGFGVVSGSVTINHVITIRGGFESCTWLQDPVVHPTSLQVDGVAPLLTVGPTGSAMLEDVLVTHAGPAAADLTAYVVAGALGLQRTETYFTSPADPGQTRTGIRLDGAGAVKMVDSILETPGADDSRGITTGSGMSDWSLELLNSHLIVSGSDAYGVRLTEATTGLALVRDSVIEVYVDALSGWGIYLAGAMSAEVGNSVLSVSGGGNDIGVTMQALRLDAGPTLRAFNNYIEAVGGTNVNIGQGIVAAPTTASQSHIIVNNILHTNAYGFSFASVQEGTFDLLNNALASATQPVLVGGVIGSVDSLTGPWAGAGTVSGNMDGGTCLLSAPDWALGPGPSDCINGGIDPNTPLGLNPPVTTDRVGTPRDDGAWDIGPSEYVP